MPKEMPAMIEPDPVAERQKRASFELDAFVIRLEGEFDISERARLLDAFAVASNCAAVVIDFKRTRYVDSTVLESLVAFQRAIGERGGKLLLVALPPGVRRIVEVCNLDRLFTIRSSLDEVMRDLSADASRVRRLTLIAEPTEAAESDGDTLK
jgi:anti-sigma B factor antagonist